MSEQHSDKYGTPRTNAAAVGFGRLLVDHGTPDNPQFKTTELVPANFARQLERELAEARQKSYSDEYLDAIQSAARSANAASEVPLCECVEPVCIRAKGGIMRCRKTIQSSTGRSVEERYGHVRMALDGLYQYSWHRPIRPSDFFPIMRFLGELVPDNPIEAGIAEWEKSDMQSATVPSASAIRIANQVKGPNHTGSYGEEAFALASEILRLADGGSHDSTKVRSEPFVCRCAGEEGLLCKTWCGDRGCK